MYPTQKEEKIIDTRNLHDYVEYDGPLKKAVEIAKHYGFNLIEPVNFSRRLPNTLTINQKERARKKDMSGFPPGKMSVLKKYFDDKMDKRPQPVMLVHLSDGPKKGLEELRLEVIGTSKSFAESVVIKTGFTILESLKHQNLCINVNSIGDRESSENFERDLTTYYKKNLNILPGCCRQHMKKAIVAVLECQNEKCQIIKENSPKSLNYLTESSRRHLGEIIEMMERLDLNYKINSDLVGNHHCYPKTIFKINEERENGENIELATGERHDHLSKEIGISKKVPIVSLSLNLKTDLRKKGTYKEKKEVRHPIVYFVHIGHEARLESLRIVEMFRNAKVPVKYTVGHESISKQLRQAEAEGAIFTVILGQKEVLEKSVIWRDVETRYQESIPIEKLLGHLKSLKKQKSL